MKLLTLIISIFFLISFSSIYAEESEINKPFELDKPKALLYVDSDHDAKLDNNEPLVVMLEDDYSELFKRRAPLNRMLRGQIKKRTYVALTHDDFMKMDTNKDNKIDTKDHKIDKKHHLYKIYFANLSGTVKGDFIATTAELVDYGTLKKIVLHNDDKNIKEEEKEHEAHFEDGQKMKIKSSSKEMPHVGL